MKKSIYALSCFLLFACSLDSNTQEVTNLSGPYYHTLENCFGPPATESSCTEFVQFRDNSEVWILMQSDILFTYTYRIDIRGIIYIDDLDMSFEIQGKNSLRRLEDGELWIKE